MTARLFVVLEGGEGSGKTSVLNKLAERFDALATREPGGTPEGAALRAMLLAADAPDWTAEAELLLMVAARIQHVRRVIMPAVQAGRMVLCDRFLGSTLAYQGAGRGLPLDLIEDLHARLVGLRPDLTVILDIDPRLGLARSARRLDAARVNEGRFEALDLDFHDRVRASFLSQAAANPTRSVVIDASHSLEEVLIEATSAIQVRTG